MKKCNFCLIISPHFYLTHLQILKQPSYSIALHQAGRPQVYFSIKHRKKKPIDTDIKAAYSTQYVNPLY